MGPDFAVDQRGLRAHTLPSDRFQPGKEDKKPYLLIFVGIAVGFIMGILLGKSFFWGIIGGVLGLLFAAMLGELFFHKFNW